MSRLEIGGNTAFNSRARIAARAIVRVLPILFWLPEDIAGSHGVDPTLRDTSLPSGCLEWRMVC
jgi:hypothetical protein